jgi:hypothetical protein
MRIPEAELQPVPTTRIPETENQESSPQSSPELLVPFHPLPVAETPVEGVSLVLRIPETENQASSFQSSPELLVPCHPLPVSETPVDPQERRVQIKESVEFDKGADNLPPRRQQYYETEEHFTLTESQIPLRRQRSRRESPAKKRILPSFVGEEIEEEDDPTRSIVEATQYNNEEEVVEASQLEDGVGANFSSLHKIRQANLPRCYRASSKKSHQEQPQK